MPRSRRGSASDSEDYGNPIAIIRTEDNGRQRGRRAHSPGIVNNNYLGVPDRGRNRARSMGNGEQIQIVLPERDHSRHSSSGSSRHSHRETSRERELRRQLRRMELDRDGESYRDRVRREERDRQRREEDERKQWLREAEIRRREDDDKRKRIVLEAQIEEEARKRKAKEDKARAVEEWKLEQHRKEEEKKKKEREFEEEFKRRMIGKGYSEASIERMLRKKGGESSGRGTGTELALVDLDRPTWIKVSVKHLHPDTLEYYGLPWKYDPRDSDYIIIKKYVDHHFQEELFRHSARIFRERGRIEGTIVKETTLKVEDGVSRAGDGMYLVRRKSTSGAGRSHSRRRSWIFT